MKQKPWLIVGTFVALWVVLSLISPTRTLHLAPAIVGAWPLFGSTIENPKLSLVNRTRLMLIGIGLGVATTAGLALAGGLEGPSLLPAGGAALEAYVFVFLGGSAAMAVSPIWREQK